VLDVIKTNRGPNRECGWTCMVANGIKRTGRDKKETAKIEVDR
jgi:hypothetical protein